MAEVNNELYWRDPFKAIASSKKQVEFVVMDMEESSVTKFAGQGALSRKHKVGNVWLQRPSEIGIGDPIFCKTHMYHLLEIGDSVFGFDLRNSNANDENMNKLKQDDIPNVIISKKIYGTKIYRNRRRQWRLKHMGLDDDMNSQNDDYIDFLEDLEEDPEMRANINLYQKRDQKPFEIDEELEENMPTVDVSEMLADLVDSDEEENPSTAILSAKEADENVTKEE